MRFIIPIIFAISAFSQPTISNVVVDDYNANGGHSSFRVTFDSNVLPDAIRVQWGPTSTYGRVMYNYGGLSGAAAKNQLLVSGLEEANGEDMTSPGRVVHVCPQAHNADGWSSCSGVDQTITIPAVPSPAHPVPPALPTVTIIPIPSSAGCTVQTAANDLSDIQSKIDSAVANQPTVCQIINIATGGTGANLGGGGHGIPYPNFPPPADADTIPASGWNISTNVITPSTSIHTFANGEHIRFGGQAFGYQALPSGIYEGQDYCVINSAGGTFKVALWPACSGVVALGSVTPPYAIFPASVTTWPQVAHYIQIRCTGVTLPPEGVRVTAAMKGASGGNRCPWLPNGVGTSAGSVGGLLMQGLTHHVYIGPGFDFTQKDSNQTNTTDPTPWPNWITTAISSDHIAIKQNWFTGVGFPERTWRGNGIEGSNIDWAENYETGVDYWMPAKTNLVPLITSSTVVTVSAGSFLTGRFPSSMVSCPAVASFTVTLSGLTTGTAFISLNPTTCRVNVTLPAGSTGTCSSPGCIALTGTGFPVNGDGNYSQGLIASCAYGSGAYQYCINFDSLNAGMSRYEPEGPTQVISYGPGPYRVANTYYSGHGNGFHFDDTATFQPNYSASLPVISNIYFARNQMTSPDLYRNGSAANNGLIYKNRNPWECKRCSIVQLDGNEFWGNYSDVNQGPSILMNGNAAGAFPAANTQFNPISSVAGDFSVTNNFLHDASAGFQIGGGPPNITGVPWLGRRFAIKNNLLYNISGWTSYAVLPGNKTSAWGFCFEPSFGAEDEVYDHNTCYSAGGSFSLVSVPVAKMIEGFQFTNNALYVGDDSNFRGMTIDWGSGGIGNPYCQGSASPTAVSCFLNGVYNWSNNLLIAGFTNTKTFSGDSNVTAWSNAWVGSGTPNTYLDTSSTVAARIVAAKWNNVAAKPSPWQNSNLRFSSGSPNISGGHRSTDGLDLGADIDRLEDALGWIKNVRALSIATSGATVAFHAPDPGAACYIGYGTGTDPATWSVSTADSATSRERSIELTGLSTKTTYFYQVWCSNTAPTNTQIMRTR